MARKRGTGHFPAFLPSTPCSAEMRAGMEAIAERQNTTLAELQRSAIALFLSSVGTNISTEIKVPKQAG